MTPPLPLPQPSHANSQRRRFPSCHRHPTKPLTGFCASCLRERLAGIDPDTHQETPITHLALELRRSKSFSSSSNPNNNASSSTSTSATTNTTISEPRRRSCDVIPRNSLSELFHHDQDGESYAKAKAKAKAVVSELEMRGDEIRVSDEPDVDDFAEEDGELKPMKEFIDLECHKKKNTNPGKDFKEIAGSFWEAASVFSKKLGKWNLKQRKKKEAKQQQQQQQQLNDEGFSATMDNNNDKGILRKLKDTLTEVGEYGRRRSCDADPRHSIDGGRLSIDDSRRSFDEPRASWDGYLIGRAYPGFTPLVSVVEDDVKLSNDKENHQIGDLNKEDGRISPGGTAQTMSYYSDPRRRKSFERSGSVKMVELELGEAISNAKVSPETVGLFHEAKLLVTEKELRDSNWYSVRDYNAVAAANNVGSLGKDVDSTAGGNNGSGDNNRKVSKSKKLPKWRNVLSMFGKKSESKFGDGESSSSGSVLNRSCTISARNSCDVVMGRNAIDSNKDGSTLQRRDQLMLTRNKSARYSPSPNNVDNGLMKFYLTPLRTDSRSKSGKSRLKNPLSLTRNVL
ncbi:Protein OCTOPUS-like [Linum grandiflorum]